MIKMNEDIEKLKDKLNKILENYEIDKKIGQLSVDSIYHMFPTEIKLVLDYIEQLQNNWNELKKWLEDEVKNLDKENPMGHDTTLTAYEGAYDNALDKMQELEKDKEWKE